MKKSNIGILKTVTYLIGLLAGFLGIFWLPRFMEIYIRSNVNLEMVAKQIFMIIYFTLIPFMFALYQSIEIISYIEHNEPFTKGVVKALKRIKQAAFTISILYGYQVVLIFLRGINDLTLYMIFGIVGFTSFVLAMFAGVLEGLIQCAVEIKTENDLTV